MTHPTPPSAAISVWSIASLPLEVAQFFAARPLLKLAPKGDGHPVMTIPGFGGADGSMAILRRWLNRWGYDARPWLLGRNLPPSFSELSDVEKAEEFSESMVEKVCERVDAIYEETGSPISLIGWSLGGIYANAVASRRPDKVRQVITLGTPFGDPRGTIIYGLMKKMARRDVPTDQDDMSTWTDRNESALQHDVATTVIYSRRDGIVAPAIARIRGQRGTENIAVRASHVGFTLNHRAYWLIANRLSQAAGEEKPVARKTRRLLRML